MPCKQMPKAPACNGPYSEAPCPGCTGQEGKCIKGKATVGCGGPFAGTACTFCKAQEKNGLFNPDVRGYLAGLDLNNVKLQHIFPKTSDYSPAQIDKRYNQLNDPNIPCPWVEIGNLYLSVTVTGMGSWGQLIDKLSKQGRKKFAVFTGRHGLEVGTVVQDLDTKYFGAGIADENHVTQDKAQKLVVEGRHSLDKNGVVTITLWNVGTTPDTTMSKTKKLACEMLNTEGTVVVFAWCYSLLSAYQLTEQQRSLLTSHAQIDCYNKPLKTIAGEKYAWADVLELRNAKLRKTRSKDDTQEYLKWRRKVVL